MKNFLVCLLIISGLSADSQVYNNEWIADYNKTYYKFKVGKEGLHRISNDILVTAGLGSVQAQDFQLWRNGVEVPIYTSASTGTFSASDYIEFWGEYNDGKPDKALYRNPDFQLNDKWSLLTDSSTYFLTTNSGSNKRLIPTANNIAGNTLSPELFFMHTVGNYVRDGGVIPDQRNYSINSGKYQIVGSEYLYSSSYEEGEGFTSQVIDSAGVLNYTFSNLYTYSSGPSAKFKISILGNAYNRRRYQVRVNGDSVLGNQMDFFNYRRDSALFSPVKISTNTAQIGVHNLAARRPDRMAVAKLELTYPRYFHFGGAKNFEFSLPASGSGNYLEIAGFSHGNTAPVLYDITNGKRYVADISNPSLVKILLEPSAIERKLILISGETSNRIELTNLQSKSFTDYSLQQNQADYIIISHPALFAGANGANPVEDYRQYRSSVNGGSFNTKIYLTEDIVDQFGFGIKNHPVALRNFLMFSRNKFSAAPSNVFLLGKAVHYVHQRYSEQWSLTDKQNMQKLNLVPTFGWPASDMLLVSDPGSSQPKTPIGRLSVIYPQEVTDYLNKVKEYEQQQKFQSPLIKDKAWMKNVVHIVGSSEPGLQNTLDIFMNNYANIIKDTLFGAKVTTFTKTSANAIQQISEGVLDKLFEEGISLMTYFGHSSSTTLEFNLNNPEQYNNQGKYPVFIGLGCNAGDFYNYNTIRFTKKETISERFTLAPNRGTIGFIASSHFGIVEYLHIYNTRSYRGITYQNYGQSIGQIMKSTIEKVFADQSEVDVYARAQCEETSLHGDPALSINSHEKPDYVIEDNMVRLTPGFVSIADQSFKVHASMINMGMALNKNIVVEVKREYPDGTTGIVSRDTIPGIRYIDSVIVNIPIDPLRDKGLNKITVTVDADNIVDELFETNNSVTKEIYIYEDEPRPVYPYNYSIVNKQGFKFIASTADPFSGIKQYKLELDTTEKFNSPFKISQTINSIGGIIEFPSTVTYTNNVVYYWRVGLVPEAGDIAWNNFSFIYLQNHEPGFNQSHYYQNTKSASENIVLDSASRNWQYINVAHNLLVRNIVFGYGGNQENLLSVSVDGVSYIRSACVGNSLIFNVFDANTFRPWKNVDANGNNLHLYGSGSANCQESRNWNFEFSYMTPQSRKNMMDFMEAIPAGSFVVVRSVDANDPGSFSSTWMSDTTLYGSGQSLYHKLLSAGFTGIDQLTSPKPWIMIYTKDDVSKTEFSVGLTREDQIILSYDVNVPSGSGEITSPSFGPALSWKNLIWSGTSSDTAPGDVPKISIIGINYSGQKTTLIENIGLNQLQFDLSAIDAKTYPYLQLKLSNTDTVHFTPYQLEKWMVTYAPAPEGAVAPNLYFSMKDTLEVGETIDFKLAFKNISDYNFSDSLKIKIVVTDTNNVSHVIPVIKHKILNAHDTLH
ncbi:MAG: C25 family cysteine peptidase, partial [Chitinophagaceae bacterium]